MSVVLQDGPNTLIIDMQPNTTLAEALDQFCRKFDLDPRLHRLSKENRNLDLSVPWRLTGFVNRAHIIVSKASESVQEVNIGLQIPAGGRIVHKFKSDTTLWEILLALEQKSGSKLNFTTHGNEKGFYMQPAVLYMSREIFTNSHLRSTTLASLGLVNGNGLLKFYYKPTTIPLAQFLKEDKENEIKEAAHREHLATEQATKVERASKEREEQKKMDQATREKLRAENEIEQKRAAEKDAEAAKIKQATAQPLKLSQASNQQSSGPKSAPSQPNLQAQPPIPREVPPVAVQKRPAPSQNTVSEDALKQQMAAKLREAQGEKPSQPALELIRMEVQKQELERLQKKQKIIDDLSQPVERNPQPFAPSSKPFSPSSIKLPDSFFVVQASDLSGVSKQQGQQEIFKSKAESKMEREQVYEKYKRFYIRVKFPDRTELQAEFSPHEHPEALFQFVEESVAVKGMDWYLYTAPPMTKLDQTSRKTFLKLGYLPAVLIHLGHPEGSPAPVLNETLAAQIKEKPIIETPVMDSTPQKAPTPASKGGGSTGSKAVPAWFKGGKK